MKFQTNRAACLPVHSEQGNGINVFMSVESTSCDINTLTAAYIGRNLSYYSLLSCCDS